MTIQCFLPKPLKVELKSKIQLRIRKKKKNLTIRTEVSVPPKAAADASCLDAAWQVWGIPPTGREPCDRGISLGPPCRDGLIHIINQLGSYTM